MPLDTVVMGLPPLAALNGAIVIGVVLSGAARRRALRRCVQAATGQSVDYRVAIASDMLVFMKP